MREPAIILASVVGVALLAAQVSPARATQLQGRVLSSEKQPIAGAEAIVFVAPAAAAVGDRTRRVTTGDDGAFTLDVGDAPGPFHVVVRAPGRVSIDVPDARPDAPLEALLPAGAAVTGIVVAAPGGEPIAGARVTLEAVTSRGSAGGASDAKDAKGLAQDATAALVETLLRPEAVADGKGSYRLEGRVPGAYVLRVEAEGRGSESRKLRLDAGVPFVADFRLARALALEGVLRGPDGAPVPGAEVVLTPFDSSKPLSELIGELAPVLRATSAADGHYAVPGLEPGMRYVARFAARGLATVRREVGVQLARAESPPRVDLTLVSPVRVMGTVVDEEGRPLPGAVAILESPGSEVEVRLTGERLSPALVELNRSRLLDNPSDFLKRPKPSPGATGADGRFAIEDAAPGTYTVRVVLDESPRATEASFLLEPGKPVLDRTVTLVLGGTLEGRVVDTEGKGIADARVSAQVMNAGEYTRKVYTVWTETDGSVSIRGVPEGTCNVSVASTGYTWRPRQVPCRSRDFEWTLTRAGEIAGRVTIEGGGSPASIRVALASGGRVWSEGVPLETEDGAYHMDAEDGAYEVVLRAPGYAVASVPDVRVTAGRRTSGVDAVLVRGASVTGVVVRRGDGAPLAGAAVVPARVRLPGEEAARSNLDGSFRVDGLASGPITLRATLPGHGPVLVVDAEARVDGSGKPVRIEMAPGGAIAGRVLRADGTPEVGARLSASAPDHYRAEALTDAIGRFRMEDLSAGSYGLRLEGTRGMPRATRSVDVRPGETAEVEIDLTPAGQGRAQGRVTRGGAPVVGAVVELSAAGAERERPLEGTTDAEGRYAIEGLAPGNAKATVREGDVRVLRDEPLVVPVSGVGERDFDLPVRFIEGRVVDASGTPAEGVWIRTITVAPIPGLTFGNVSSGSGGEFRIPIGTTGPIDVRAERKDGASVVTRVSVGERGVDGVELRLGESGVIRLRVTDESDRPLASAVVAVMVRGEQTSMGGASVTPSGRYEWRGAKGAVVAFTVRAPGLAPASLEVTCPVEDVQVVLREGGALEVLLPASAVGSRARLLWSLKDASGVDIGNGLRMGGEGAPLVEDMLASDGHVRFRSLPPGAYTFVLRRVDGKSIASAETPVVVEAGIRREVVASVPATDVVAEAAAQPAAEPQRVPSSWRRVGKSPAGPVGSLVMRLDPDNAPPPPLQTFVFGPGGVALWPVGTTPAFREAVQEGRMRRFDGVAVGAYTVIARAPDGRSASATVTVTEGRTAEALLRFAR